VAARSTKRRDDAVAAERGDEDALDPVEAADVDTDEDAELAEAGLSELDVDDEFDDDTEDETEADDLEVPLDVPLEEGEDLEGEAVVTAVPADAAFDDEDEARVAAAVVGDDDDDEDDGIEGLRDGEFVCRSCYMAKRESQLADPDRMLCRDCA
jgi:hypothetical protein